MQPDHILHHPIWTHKNTCNGNVVQLMEIRVADWMGTCFRGHSWPCACRFFGQKTVMLSWWSETFCLVVSAKEADTVSASCRYFAFLATRWLGSLALVKVALGIYRKVSFFRITTETLLLYARTSISVNPSILIGGVSTRKYCKPPIHRAVFQHMDRCRVTVYFQRTPLLALLLVSPCAAAHFLSPLCTVFLLALGASRNLLTWMCSSH